MKFRRNPGARTSQLADLLARIQGAVGGPVPATPPLPSATAPAPASAALAPATVATTAPRRKGGSQRKRRASEQSSEAKPVQDAAAPGPSVPIAPVATPASAATGANGAATVAVPAKPTSAQPVPTPAPSAATAPTPALTAPSQAPAGKAPAPAAKPEGTAAPSVSAKSPAATPSATPGAGGAGQDVDGRLDKLEAAFASMKDLRDLSEIISVQYNPFLEAGEHAAAGRPSAPAEPVLRVDVPAAAHTPVAAPAAVEPVTSVAPVPAEAGPHAPAGPVPDVGQADAKAAEPVPPAPGRDDRPAGAAPAVPEPRAGAHAPHHSSVLAAAPMNTAMDSLALPHPSMYGPRGLFTPNRPVGGPRETFLAIHWFTYLAEGTDPSIIYLYLDYYQRAGWFGGSEFAWLEQLARGLAPRRDRAEWSDYGLDSRRLAQNHLRNLRVLDKLFGATLQHGEAQYLQQTLDALLAEA